MASSGSPYLLQHALNPVEWFPWGEEAFDLARRRDCPIFLSAGYASCHWCHVMAHESFEDTATAEQLNRCFVCVKVDREERPDIDAVYMHATQILTGQGGWPNSVWLTPDGRPWIAGTYIPRDDRGGRMGLRSLAVHLDDLWRHRRSEIEAQADRLTAAVRLAADPARAPSTGPTPPGDPVDRAVDALRRQFDPVDGGFGGPPRFPPHSEIELLVRYGGGSGRDDGRTMAARVLDAMQAGGIHDLVGGGFFRYSTDASWFLPHFEKMLSDNARLLHAYARAARETDRADYARTAEGIARWMLDEMRSPEGAFFTALDADSPGGEGRYYLWSHDEWMACLGEAEGAWAASVFGVVPEGNVLDEATGRAIGLNLPHVASPPSPDGLDRMADALRTLRDSRRHRAPPNRDGKILASWNGLAIGALASAGRHLERPEWIRAAVEAAEFVGSSMRDGEGRLARTVFNGQTRAPACLEDMVHVADGFLDLHDAGGDPVWLDRAGELAGDMLNRFRDQDAGGFYSTPDDRGWILAREKDPFDGAMPSPNAVACRVLLRLYAKTQSEVYRVMADECLRVFEGVIARAPRAACSFLRARLLAAEGGVIARGGDTAGP